MYSYSTWDAIKEAVNPHSIGYDFHLQPNTDEIYYPLTPENTYEYVSTCNNNHSEVKFTLNKLLFRTGNFTELTEGANTALYSGCSFTYGVGIPEEFLWTTLLTNKLELEKQFNLGISGSSVFLTIKNLMSFIRMYGKPKYIFVVMPPIARDFKYDVKKERFYPVLRGGNYFEGDYPKAFLEYAKHGKYEDDIMKAVNEIKLFEDYCNAAGIKFVWTYWYAYDEPVYKEYKFDNIMYQDPNFKLFSDENGYYENTMGWPFWELAQDDLHLGTCWHNHVAETLYKVVAQ